MKIFLSVSYSSQLDDLGQVLADYRRQLEDVIAVFEDNDHQVFCAPREEGWKINDASPAEGLELDIKHLSDSDMLVALVGSKISAGIQLELGYGLALGKRLILATPSNEPLSYINRGLVDAGHANLVQYQSPADLAEKLAATLKSKPL